MAKEALPRIDSSPELHKDLAAFCRLKPGAVWEDTERGHRVGLLDATRPEEIEALTAGEKAVLAVQDPPYNITVGNRKSRQLFEDPLEEYIRFSRSWLENTFPHIAEDGHLYIWLGADQTRGFQPLPDFMLLMRDYHRFKSRSFITLRNQRGYGTQKNWMWVRQELLYYTCGAPAFRVAYTDIPKKVKGYYKAVGGVRQENMERSRSDTIRPGNIWTDIQQVFYRKEENVPGAYAQKPLKSIERILLTSSRQGDTALDFFAHAGTTLLAAERTGRRCFTCDNDPVFAELAIRRLEHYRKTGKTGWQWRTPFPEYQAGIKT